MADTLQSVLTSSSMKPLFATLLLILPSVLFAAPPREAFQGVNWGASEAAIRKAFPGQVRDRPCPDAASAAVHQIARTVCGGPSIARYVVNGFPFEVKFELDAKTRSLVGVTLAYEHAFDDRVGQTPESWLERSFASFDEALTVRYGQGSSAKMTNSKLMTFKTKHWSTSNTKFMLKVGYYGDGTAPSDKPTITITYRPVGGADSGKL